MMLLMAISNIALIVYTHHHLLQEVIGLGCYYELHHGGRWIYVLDWLVRA